MSAQEENLRVQENQGSSTLPWPSGDGGSPRGYAALQSGDSPSCGSVRTVEYLFRAYRNLASGRPDS